MAAHPDVDEFIAWLGRLDADDITAVAGALEDRGADAAAELSWWATMVEVERRLRIQRAGRAASIAALAATRAVARAAGAAGFAADDPRVVAVTHAAVSAAHAVIAHVDDAGPLLPGWHAPTAA